MNKLVARVVQTVITERETHSYSSKEETDEHEAVMLSSGWSKETNYEFDDRYYLIFVRETELEKKD